MSKVEEQAQLNTEIDHLEAELVYLSESNYDPDSHAVQEVQRQLHEAYQKLSEVTS